VIVRPIAARWEARATGHRRVVAPLTNRGLRGFPLAPTALH